MKAIRLALKNGSERWPFLGARVQAFRAPTTTGVSFVIRKPARRLLTLADLVQQGAVSEAARELLTAALRERKKDQTLHRRVQVEGQDHDPPPCRVLAEVSRGQLASGEIFFHHRVRLFTLAAALGPFQRPVWLAYFGTESESQAFSANLRGGRPASAPGTTLLLPRRSPHRWTLQKVPGGLVTVVYLPDLFHLQPELPPGGPVHFVFAPPRWWVEAQAQELASEFGADAQDAARAALFCAFLDHRTPLPLVHDLRFHLQLYRAAQETSWLHPLDQAGRGGGVLVGQGAEAAGLDAPMACKAHPAELAAFVIQQTTLFHQEELARGKTRIPRSSRLLPYPGEAPAQLRLDFAVA